MRGRGELGHGWARHAACGSACCGPTRVTPGRAREALPGSGRSAGLCATCALLRALCAWPMQRTALCHPPRRNNLGDALEKEKKWK